MSLNFLSILKPSDIKYIENIFANVYYKNMAETGFSSNLIMFDEKCACTINSEHSQGAYNVLVKLAQNNIYRFNYKSASSDFQQLANNQWLVNVGGICQLVNFQNMASCDISFSETFILNNNNKIVNYILKLY